MKRPVKLLSRFLELDYENGASLADLRFQRIRANKQSVLEYLKSARPLVVSPGTLGDVFDPLGHAGSGSILTDGTYAWHDALAYYLDEYDIVLPEEFEEHMKRLAYRCPSDVELAELQLDDLA